MIDLFTIKQAIIESSEFAAMQIIKNMYPDMDDLSYNKAFIVAGSNGRRWLEYHIKHGNIHPTRRGTTKNSKLMFSRVEIHALKKAEQMISMSILDSNTN